MPPIRENESVGPYRTIQPLPALHKDDLVEAWLSQPPDEREEVVLNILRIPPDGLDEKHRRAYKALENEVKILKRVRHLNIVRIYPLHPHPRVDLLEEGYLSRVEDQGEARWFWAMEHLEGGSLAGMIEQLGRLPLQEAAEVTYQIAMALDYIHSKGIVHLNVRPQNVFFRHPMSGPNPRVELVLAGFASAAGADQEIVDERMAEVEFKSYVSPERIKPGKVSSDQSLDNRPQDIYLLGVLFYHMLAGAPPFTGSDEDIRRAILGFDPPPLPRLGVPAEIGDLIFQALRKDPAGRPSLEHLLISLDKNV
ncbi:MAG: serine/threonine protein kinase, partial [Anaerolineae bacterium]|nr:serine/threonine protein kinase [Anaerolineae bacterium]